MDTKLFTTQVPRLNPKQLAFEFNTSMVRVYHVYMENVGFLQGIAKSIDSIELRAKIEEQIARSLAAANNHTAIADAVREAGYCTCLAKQPPSTTEVSS